MINDAIREGKIRFMSIGNCLKYLCLCALIVSAAYDGSGFLWESNVTGNIIEIAGNDPIGHFLSQGSISQHLDEGSDTLFTVSADRTIRFVIYLYHI